MTSRSKNVRSRSQLSNLGGRRKKSVSGRGTSARKRGFAAMSTQKRRQIASKGARRRAAA